MNIELSVKDVDLLIESIYVRKRLMDELIAMWDKSASEDAKYLSDRYCKDFAALVHLETRIKQAAYGAK